MQLFIKRNFYMCFSLDYILFIVKSWQSYQLLLLQKCNRTTSSLPSRYMFCVTWSFNKKDTVMKIKSVQKRIFIYKEKKSSQITEFQKIINAANTLISGKSNTSIHCLWSFYISPTIFGSALWLSLHVKWLYNFL